MPVQRAQKRKVMHKPLGRSVSGFSCKIPVLTDALGYPLRLVLTPGQTVDVRQAKSLITSVPIKVLLVDKGYDSQDFIAYLYQAGIKALISSHFHAKQP
jgi:hypothetical protein